MKRAQGPVYVEQAPRAELRRYVECYWSVTCLLPPGCRERGRVLPDGCIDILFALGDPRGNGGGAAVSSRVIGSMTRAIEVDYAGHVELVGVRFRPGGAMPWLDASADELTDQAIGLEDLWGAAAGWTRDRLGEAEAGERAGVLDQILIDMLDRSARAVDERVLHASAAVAAHCGGLPIEQLADAAGLGRRQLERRFLACVGLPPKTASRVARFRALVARMHAEPAGELTRLALDAGYADQAHMTREFRALAGVTPGAYRAGIRAVTPDTRDATHPRSGRSSPRWADALGR